MEFRVNTPSRRTKQKKYVNYHAYKGALKADFHSRCGYCDDPECFPCVHFQIDHFVPKVVMRTIKENDYNNLVYSCPRCNRAKWDKWPTQNEMIHNDGKEGFIDPCDPKYDQQFKRNERGEIIPTTQLGNWMWKELDLGNAAHRIIWTLEQLKKEMDRICQTEDSPMATLWHQYSTFIAQICGT